MALKFGDRVQETTTTTSTGTYTLAGAVTGYRSFTSFLSNGDTCYYAITDGTNWEVGLGTFTTSGTTLARTTILASSNAGSAVSWSAGTKNIWIDVPASIILASAVVTVKKQTFAASGTYTPSTGMLFCLGLLQAPGGGGGGGSSGVPAGGGGGGGSAIGLFSAATIGASQTVTIGAIGSAGSSSGPTSGGTGGTTSLGALLSATGGVGGINGGSAAENLGGAGGAATAGDVQMAGGGGGASMDQGGNSTAGGIGGNAFFGGGAVQVKTGAGVAGGQYGGGGGGGWHSGNGGGGGAGFLYMIEFCSQ